MIQQNALNLACQERGLDRVRRVSMLLAQCLYETGGFRYFTEFGDTAYFKQYDGCMGNTEKDDAINSGAEDASH